MTGVEGADVKVDKETFSEYVGLHIKLVVLKINIRESVILNAAKQPWKVWMSMNEMPQLRA